MKNKSYKNYNLSDCINELEIVNSDKIDYLISFLEKVREDQKKQNIKIKKLNKFKTFSKKEKGVKYFNNFFQDLGLMKMYSVGPIKFGPKVLKSNYKDKCGCLNMLRELFPYMFHEKMCEKHVEVDEIRLMGANHLFTAVSLLFLKYKILNDSIKLDENCKLLLLCGNHVNNYYGEDMVSEIECAKILVELIFNGIKNFKIKNHGKEVVVKVIPVSVNKKNRIKTDLGIFWSHAKTIDTILKANELNLNSKNIIYLATQPFLTRHSYNHIYYGFEEPTCLGLDVDNFLSLMVESIKDLEISEKILNDYEFLENLEFCENIKDEYENLKKMPEYKELSVFSDDLFLRLAPAYVLSEIARFVNVKTLLNRKRDTASVRRDLRTSSHRER